MITFKRMANKNSPQKQMRIIKKPVSNFNNAQRSFLKFIFKATQKVFHSIQLKILGHSMRIGYTRVSTQDC